MKNIILLFLFLFPVFLFAQYPATGNKQRLGYQTTGDGLIWRGVAADTAIKPRTTANAYFQLDTVNRVLRRYIATQGSWQVVAVTPDLSPYLLIADTAAMLLNYPSTAGYGIIDAGKTWRADTTSPNGLATRLFAKTLPTSILTGQVAYSNGSNLIGNAALTFVGNQQVVINSNPFSSTTAKIIAASNGTNNGGETGLEFVNLASTVSGRASISVGNVAATDPYLSIRSRQTVSPFALTERMRFNGDETISMYNNTVVSANLTANKLGIGTTTFGTILAGVDKLEIHAENEQAGMLSVSWDNSGAFPNTSLGGGFVMGKARGTKASPSNVAINDRSAYFLNTNYVGSWQNTAGISFYIDGAVSSGVAPTQIRFETGTSTATRATRAAITSGGNLLLGTTTDVATSILTARSTTKSSSPFPLHTLAESDAITGVQGNFDYETTQNGLRWYNGTRKAYALESTFARGTATRVPFFDANGQMTDNAGFNFSTTNGLIASGTVSFGFLGYPNTRIGVVGTSPRLFLEEGSSSNSLWDIDVVSNSLRFVRNSLTIPVQFSTGGNITTTGSVFSTGTTQNTWTASHRITSSGSGTTNLIYGTANPGSGTGNSVAFQLENTNGSSYKTQLIFGGTIASTNYFAFGTDILGNGTNNYFLYSGAGNTTPLFINSNGRVRIGTTGIAGGSTTIDRTLHVAGEARITDLITDPPTQIVGADADGDLGAISIASDLKLTSGSLGLKRKSLIDSLPLASVTIDANGNNFLINDLYQVEFKTTNLSNFGLYDDDVFYVNAQNGFDLRAGLSTAPRFFGESDRMAFRNTGTPSADLDLDNDFLDLSASGMTYLNVDYTDTDGFQPYDKYQLKNQTPTLNNGEKVIHTWTGTGTLTTTPAFEYLKKDTTIYIDDTDYDWSSAISTVAIAAKFNRVIFWMTTTGAAGSDSEITLHTPDVNLMQVEYLIHSVDEAGGFTNVIRFGTNNAVDSTNGLVSSYFPAAGQGVGIRAGLRSSVYKYRYY